MQKMTLNVNILCYFFFLTGILFMGTIMNSVNKDVMQQKVAFEQGMY